jgi:hypothetical protein
LVDCSIKNVFIFFILTHSFLQNIAGIDMLAPKAWPQHCCQVRKDYVS